jgi:hypothetical protein
LEDEDRDSDDALRKTHRAASSDCMYGINDKINPSLVIIENLITAHRQIYHMMMHIVGADGEVKQLSIQRT